MTAGAPALAALLDELDRLRAAATPGEWEHIVDHHRHGAEHSIWGGASGRYVAEYVITAADAALIAEMHAAVPRLTAAVRAALAVADELSRVDEQFEVGDLRAALAAAFEPTP